MNRTHNIKDKLPEYGQSIFAQMTFFANAHNAINLAQGFPEEDGPPELLQFLGEAAQKGFNQYAPMTGLPGLNKAIADKWQKEYGIQLDPKENIQISPGATQAIFTALQALVHPGDEVIVFTPAYDSFIPGIKLAGGKAVVVPTYKPDFEPDWEKFEAAISPKTKAVLVNTPHNPSGRCFSEED
ncbi:MAG: aminotransferase class I/II-fold pyridoxal phosphate-dependent enzyme, partial [Chitinophagales bacterium]